MLHECPECDGPGRVFVVGSTSPSTAHATVWYDVAGRYHVHDPNWVTSLLRCDQGHSWSVRYQLRCPSCAYGMDTEQLVPVAGTVHALRNYLRGW